MIINEDKVCCMVKCKQSFQKIFNIESLLTFYCLLSLDFPPSL